MRWPMLKRPRMSFSLSWSATPVLTVAELGEIGGDRQRSPDAAGKLKFDDKGHVCLGFGKYSGWTLENIGRNDPGYLQWLMTKAELPASTLAIMKNVLSNMEA